VLESELIRREEANGHSIYGASKSPRYLLCTGSLRAEIGLPDTARFEAAEGTVAHEVADTWMRTGREPRERIGEVVTVKLETGTYNVPIDAAMLTHLGGHVERCLSAPGQHYFEQRVDYSRLTPILRQGGTADHFVCAPQHLVIDDLKYGVADQIFAERNSQPMLYGLGVIYEWDWLYAFERVTIRIHQPRLDHWDVWETTVSELLEFAEWARVRMHQAWRPDAPRTPSEKACRYCKAKLQCPEAAQALERVLDDVFDDLTPPFESTGTPALWGQAPPAETFAPWPAQSTDALVNMLSYRKLFEKLFDDAYEELKTRILRGDKVPGWMVAQGKNSRHVSDEGGAAGFWDLWGLPPEALWERKFLSPAKLEERLVQSGVSLGLARKLIAPYVHTSPGVPVVAPVTKGKREALDLADDTFEDLTPDL